MWSKIDDGWWTHRKLRAAARRCNLAPGCWSMAAAAVNQAGTDGVVTPDLLDDVAMMGCFVGQAEDVAAALVASGLWHDAKSLRKCERCKVSAGRLPAGSFYFHDWLIYQYTKDEAKIPEVRWKRTRMKDLHRDHVLKARILERDRDCCRYCAVRVDFRDRISEIGGTYDHVDPSVRENTFENVVVACKGCNTRKSDRTPTEAGMFLLPAPDLYPDLATAKSGDRLGSSHAGAGHASGDGPGRDLATARSPVSNGSGGSGSSNGKGATNGD